MSEEINLSLNEKLMLIMSKKENMSIFERNLIAVAEYSALLAEELLNVKTNQEFQVYLGKDPVDINIVNVKNQSFVYNNPVKDVAKKIEYYEDEYARYPALFFYGLGNGVFYKAILNNQSHKNIIVFEPEIEIIYIVLNLFDFSKDLHSARFLIFKNNIMNKTMYAGLTEFSSIINTCRLYNLNIHSRFYDAYEQDFVQINKNMTEVLKTAVLQAGNDATDTLTGIIHHTKNIPNMIENLPIRRIVDKRKQASKTAIVVSTGPSLAKQLPLLKRIAPYVTIVSVDASYPILKKNGIKPDYVTSIERVEATSQFFESKVSDFDKGIIFVVASLTHPQTIKNLKGREVSYVMRPLSYEKGFNNFNFGYIGSGMSAAHLAYDLAIALEHKNVVFIGQDLAYGKGGITHSKGHIFSQKEWDSSDEKYTKSVEYAPAYGGDGEVGTTKVWNLFRHFFEYTSIFAKKQGVRIINSTEGGARIEGFEELPFKDVCDKILKNPKIKKFAKVNPFPKSKQKTELNKSIRHIKKIIKLGKKIKNKSEKLFLKLAKEVEKVKKFQEEGKEEKIDYLKLQKIAFEIDDIKALIEDPIFITSYYGVCGLNLSHQNMELAQIMVRNSKTDKEKKEKLIQWVSLHGYWLFSLAGYIEAELDEIIKSSKWMEKA